MNYYRCDRSCYQLLVVLSPLQPTSTSECSKWPKMKLSNLRLTRSWLGITHQCPCLSFTDALHILSLLRSSYYKKAGLSPAIDRVRMCELAVEHTSTWLMVDPWEAGQSEYKRTAIVLDHFDQMVNIEGGGLTMSDGRRRKYKVMLLAGGDLIESFGEPGQWSEPDVSLQ